MSPEGGTIMLDNPFCRVLSLYLIIALFALSIPVPGWAMLLPAERSEARPADQAAVQAALESSAVKQRLLDYGLSPEETAQRLGSLSDEQIHQLAANLDAVQAGGILGDVIVILLIVLIIILVLQLSGHHVIIRR
jgi:hypothetical protein